MSIRCLIVALLSSVLGGTAYSAAPDDDFEKTIRPLLVDHCQRCHGAEKQKGGLRLDTRAEAFKGGDSGVVIVAGKPEASLLLKAVRREGDLKMPPDQPLKPEQVDAIQKWIEAGAAWPKDAPKKAASKHWAFQPVAMPKLPDVKNAGWCQTPIDRFILAKLEAEKLEPAKPADRRTLIRRITYDLTGLPPTHSDVEAFVKDDSPEAYAKLVERLLASPRYGEHWGRHWLDVARYSDSKGYVYDREEKFWVHAWTYRDWVVKALNDDLPYDQFIRLQLAADVAVPNDQPAQAAMGFLTVGRRFIGVTHDIIDDRIDVVTRGLLGLTVTCARCHAHKFDPVPIEDYYSLYGVFRSSREKLIPIGTVDANAADAKAFQQRYAKELAAYEQLLAKRKLEAANRVRGRVADYLLAQFELEKYPEEGFDVNILPQDMVPATVRRWRDYLRHQKANPVWAEWFAATPQNREEIARRYGQRFAEADAKWKQIGEAALRLDDDTQEAYRRVLYGPDSPCEVPDGMMADIEWFFPTRVVEGLWKQRKAVDRALIESAAAPPQALVLIDAPEPVNGRVFRRGNPSMPGEEVPRHFLSLLKGRQFQQGSGRLELANAIADPANPLTARVMVNRVWMNHFGAGLVRSPSDFGTRAEPPSHPELLDWLAATFAKDWSLKNLHRTIVHSAAYQQAGGALPSNDPENRWLSRRTPRRLGFEELRDSMFAATGELDASLGGRPVPLFSQPFTKRRTLYGEIDREYLPGPFRTFDFANPDLHTPSRSETTVPQQPLFFLNHPLPLERARALAKVKAETPAARVTKLFQNVFQRTPTEPEIQRALAFVKAAEADPPPKETSPWQYGSATLKDDAVRKFKPLPVFTGDAWQTEPGTLKLTALGGHAVERLVVVRRWASPIDGTVSISSRLQHKPKEGDGVRGLIIGPDGKLAEGVAFKNTIEISVKSVEVKVGDVIDFVVDSRKNDTADDFLWAPVIAINDSETSWDARRDFRGPVTPLLPWEQLAQVLLMSNEFLFVD